MMTDARLGHCLFVLSALISMAAFRSRLRSKVLGFRRGLISSAIRRFSNSQDRSSESLPDHWMKYQGEHSFLENVLGDDALAWVGDQNKDALARLGDPSGSPLYNRVLSILDSKDKIPYGRKIGDHIYNFWQDDKNPRGTWRRASMESYKSRDPAWELVLDLDALGKAENESWVFKGSRVYDLEPETPPSRALLYLSRGGADACVVREFDLENCAFVPEDQQVPSALSLTHLLNLFQRYLLSSIFYLRLLRYPAPTPALAHLSFHPAFSIALFLFLLLFLFPFIIVCRLRHTHRRLCCQKASPACRGRAGTSCSWARTSRAMVRP